MSTTPASATRRPRRRNVPAFVPGVILAALLTSVFYLFAQVWATTASSASTVATERAVVAYAQPLNKLLAALVDARYAATLGTAVDPAGVQAAVREVNAVDRESTDQLQIGQRWTQAAREIDRVLGQNARGPEALLAYAAPIALTQALLGRIADVSGATHDPGRGSYQLTEVALRSLPDVIVNAGLASALALTPDSALRSASKKPNRPVDGSDPQLTIARDRLARAAGDVSTSLRAGTEQGTTYTADLTLLRRLDEFVAAAGDLDESAVGADAADNGGVRDRIDATNTLVKTKALALETAVLDVFDTQMATYAGRYARQRQLLVLAAVVIALATGALLWLRASMSAAPKGNAPARPDEPTEGRHSYPATDYGGTEPNGTRRVAEFAGIRGQLPRLAPAGRTVQGRKRHDPDDH